MKVKQFKLGAVINLGEYSDIRPEVTVELEKNDNPDDARKMALDEIQKVWGATNNKQLTTHVSLPPVNRQEVTCFASGTVAYFDPISHTYVDAEGKPFMSGSVYAGQFEHEFQEHLVIDKSATKLNLTKEQVKEYWQSKGDVSTTFGNALHKALEHYGRWKATCDVDTDYKTKESKGTGIHPTLLPIVEDFFERFKDEQAIYEPFIADPKNMRCGFVDRLVITGEKRCIIDDYKTNGDLYKKGTPANLKAPYAYLPNVPLSRYTIQLSFYRAIMMAHGWTVEGLRVHWWNGTEWTTIELKPVEIDVKQEPIDLSKVI